MFVSASTQQGGFNASFTGIIAHTRERIVSRVTPSPDAKAYIFLSSLYPILSARGTYQLEVGYALISR